MLHFWLFYLIGQLVHLLKRMNQDVQSPAVRLNTYKQFWYVNWPNVIIRVFLCSVGFLLWAEDGANAAKVLNSAGISLPQLPLTHATAAIYGFFSDSLVDWVMSKFPQLQKDLP